MVLSVLLCLWLLSLPSGTWSPNSHGPRPTSKIQIQSTAYVVLRGTGVPRPVALFSAAEYYRVLFRFTKCSLSHSWPSQVEARIYCLAAGIAVPAEI